MEYNYVIISGKGFWGGYGFNAEYPRAKIFTNFQVAHKEAKWIIKKYGNKLPVMFDGENLSIVENYGLENEKPVCMLSI